MWDEFLVRVRRPHIPLFVELVCLSVPIELVDHGVVKYFGRMDEILLVLENIAPVKMLWTVILGPGTVVDSHFFVQNAVVIRILTIFGRRPKCIATPRESRIQSYSTHGLY
jgi:hypothetical protein